MPKEVFNDQTPESLAAIAEQLESAATELRAKAERMRQLEFPLLRVTHFNAITLGMTSVKAFVGAVESAIDRARVERGHYGTLSDKNGRKEPKPRVKKGQGA